SANAGAFADLMQAVYPVEEGDVTVRAVAPVELTLDLVAPPNHPYAGIFPTGHPFWMLDGVIAKLRDMRAQAQSGAYYYGLGEHQEIFGYADGIPSPVAYGTTTDGIVTLAHELGHNF